MQSAKKKKEILSILQLISKISENTHRTQGFFTKIEQIIKYLLQHTKLLIPLTEIIKIYESNKRLLLLLLEID